VRYRDAAQCESLRDCSGAARVVAAATSGAIEYNPSLVGACFDRLGSSCASPLNNVNADSVPDTYQVLADCPGAITPLLGAGQTCASNSECSSGLQCKRTVSCLGACESAGALGDDCADVPCNPELVCDTFTVKCTQKPAVGDACQYKCNYTVGAGQWSLTCPSDQLCTADLWCNGELGTCQPGGLVGDACGHLGLPPTDSQASCAVNLWCALPLDSDSGTCQAPGGVGGPCTDAPSACQAGLHCIDYVPVGPGATFGQCAGISALGSKCSYDGDCQSGLVCIASSCQEHAAQGAYCFRDVDCQAGLVCQASSCQVPSYPGDPCGPDAPCRFGNCKSGTCQALAKLGESCASADDCLSSSCQGGVCYADPNCVVR
jgi:hypothetical protein